jgi:uncharacterized protein (DUF1778 family)
MKQILRRKGTSVRFSERERSVIDEASRHLGRTIGEFIRLAAAEKAFEVLKDAGLTSGALSEKEGGDAM